METHFICFFILLWFYERFGNVISWKWTAQAEPGSIKHLIKLPSFFPICSTHCEMTWTDDEEEVKHFILRFSSRSSSSSSFPPSAEEVKIFTCRLISCDTCSCMAGCCWVWSLSSFSCHKSSAEICNRPGRHPAYLLRRLTNSKILLPWLMWSSTTGGISFASLKPEDPAIIWYVDVKSTIVHNSYFTF